MGDIIHPLKGEGVDCIPCQLMQESEPTLETRNNNVI